MAVGPHEHWSRFASGVIVSGSAGGPPTRGGGARRQTGDDARRRQRTWRSFDTSHPGPPPHFKEIWDNLTTASCFRTMTRRITSSSSATLATTR